LGIKYTCRRELNNNTALNIFIMKRNKIIVTCFFLIALSTLSNGQNAQSAGTKKSSLVMDTILKQGPEYNLINPLIGNWEVIQIIYAMDSEKILSQDTFKVERKMVGNFLQEVMQPMDNKKTNAFTRIAYLNYNRTNLRWEYIVLDTRYPVTMFETSQNSKVSGDNSITVGLDAFVVPPFWGMSYAGMLGKQRRVITFKKDITINEQYWTLAGGKEFLAIKYIYLKHTN
jgi:hypothetical protein